jgi:hypothetical protein
VGVRLSPAAGKRELLTCRRPTTRRSIGDFALTEGATLHDAKLAFKTYGTLSDARDNAIVDPTWYSGRHWDNEWLIGDGMALDPARYFIIVPNMLGNGLSASPSNTPPPSTERRFPRVRVQDNVRAQHPGRARGADESARSSCDRAPDWRRSPASRRPRHSDARPAATTAPRSRSNRAAARPSSPDRALRGRDRRPDNWHRTRSDQAVRRHRSRTTPGGPEATTRAGSAATTAPARDHTQGSSAPSRHRLNPPDGHLCATASARSDSAVTEFRTIAGRLKCAQANGSALEVSPAQACRLAER